MNFSLYIAKRYLFSKKSHNAINIISLVAVCGVTIATMAAVCTLCVFNGFQGLVSDMFGSFDPELKISAVKGKVFDPESERIKELYAIPEIEFISEVLEDNVLVKYGERQTPAVMKGVSGNFEHSSQIRDILFDGEYILQDSVNQFVVLGIGVAGNLGVNANFIYPLEIYTPKRNAQVNLSNPLASFHIESAYIGGVFMIGQVQYDDSYLIVSLDLARRLLDYGKEVSALEIKMKPGYNISTVQKKIRRILGDEYTVKDRYEQQEAAFRMISIEKWVSYLMLCFIILIAAFNIIGSMSILMVDKQQDMITLRNMGAGSRLITRIFLFEGWLVSVFGAVAGVILGLLVCGGQAYFGWIKLGSTQGAFAVDAYPVVVAWGDIFIVLTSVLLIGFLVVLYPVRYLSKKLLLY